MTTTRQCPHGFHHPAVSHSCDGCWCEGESDRARYGWQHDTSPADITSATLRTQHAEETQRDRDARFASYFSTSTEMNAYSLDAVKEVFRKAI